MDNELSAVETENGTFTIEDEKKEETKSKKAMNAKKIKILICAVCGNFLIGSCYALMAPFFPQEAEKKNASPTVYGLIFGISQLTIFISSPVYGKIIPILKPRFVMNTGLFLSGTCNIFFGLLDYAPAGPSFIGLAIAIRFFVALGSSAYITASYATLGTELAEIIGRAMSLTETAFAIGLAGGPVIGGFFYELGGFRLPFMVMGLALVVATGVNMLLISSDERDVPSKSISALSLLNDVDFIIDVITIGSCFALIGFNDASLEPHVRQFNLSPVTTGLVFLTSNFTDAVFSPVWGYFAEKVPNAHYLTFLGILLLISSYLIVGPASFLNFRTLFWVVILSQFLFGLGMASSIVCSFTHGMKHTLKRGFPNDVGTYSVVSGVLLSASFLGSFIGPSVGGVLIDEIGYIHSTEVAVGLEALTAVICAGRLIYLCFRRKEEESF